MTQRRLLLALGALLLIQSGLVLADLAWPPPMARALRASPLALDRQGGWLRALPVEHGRWRIRADLSRTDTAFLKRLIAVEDARFDIHQGVDPVAVIRAIGSALVSGQVRSGASTLTMQTVRLMEPRPRILSAKMLEAIRAVQLEARMSKREILALYLTLAPYGGNLEGVRAASLAYFGHEPSSLTDAEQALLIALPQAPERRRPDRHPHATRAARAAILNWLSGLGLLTTDRAKEAQAEPLPARSPFPLLAFHVAGELARNASPDLASIDTTLDRSLQQRLEPMVVATAKQQGEATNVAALIVEIRGRAVRAAVGSAGRDRPGGWIDMTQAVRSPGSALKPFIYGLAFDDGLLAPDTEIDDRPTRFLDYQPENFDRTFHGRVTAREALVHSLNVPAVSTLDKLGAAAFQARLQAAGARLVRPKAGWSDAGLALALGGEGITLRDLAMLYAALGDGGLAKPLAWIQADAERNEKRPGLRLMGSGSADTVLAILRDAPTPSGRMPAALTRNGPGMAFKTGTSYGFRDAIAIGVTSGYVIAVWTGRSDGGARGGLTGRDAALPLLFDIADLLKPASAVAPVIGPKAAPTALTRLVPPSPGPRLIFPPDGSTVQIDSFGPSSRGLSLAATGTGLRWSVNGVLVPTDAETGRTLWYPKGPGFYQVAVTDADGRTRKARVRLRP